MKPLLLLLLLLCYAPSAAAQSLRISGEVSSAATGEGVALAVVRLLEADTGTLIATDTTRYQWITEKGERWQTEYADKQSGAVFSIIAPAKEEYELVVEAKGFDEFRCRVTPEAGKETVSVPPIYLLPIKERQLDEVVVKATRIKMYYKGDTLIYNADAFNVEQTESLRKLVQQLPGAELTADGEIRVNGKRVDNLLISGKDFFQGNIQSALDNLPAYIVSRIKVYDKAGEQSELTGRDMHDESFVMDVHLKRKYVGMWMARLSADGGTEGLWGGQAFLMRFDDRQMISVNADVNNFNQDREMNELCDMSENPQEGQISHKTARVNYYIEPNKTWRFTANGKVSRKDTDQQSWQNSETYLSPNNLMSRSAEQLDGEDFTATASAELRARKSGHWQHTLSYSFDYDRSRETHDSQSFSYYEENTASENALLYSLLEPELSRSRSLTHKPKWQSSFVLGSNVLNFNASLKHETQTQREFSNYRLTTYADETTDARRRFKKQRDYQLNFETELEWVHKYERLKRFDGVVKPFLQYSRRYETARHPEYRLERMTEWSDLLDWGLASLGKLPEAEWQELCLDAANSYFSTEKEDKAEAGVQLSHKTFFERGTSLLVEANESFYYQHRTLDYDREGEHYRPSREGIFFHPALTLKWKYEDREGRRWMPECDASYQGQSAMPALTQLLPIRDDSDPLNLFAGNADLDNSFAHELNVAYRLQHVKSHRSLNLNATYRRLHNDIATQSAYDAATGIRTYQPENTSRTHAVKGRTEFISPLDSKQRVYLSAFFSADYYQAENLSSLVEEGTTSAGLLRNVGLTPGLSLRATVGSKLRFYGSWNTAFRRASQPGMSENYRETTLYGDFRYTLPWGLHFSTLIKTNLYAGNSEDELNQTTTNWDASLSKYFLKDRLGIHIKAHDILAQASTYRSEITATGRLENYTDVLPRYLMLTISYNFNWVGKK